MPAAASAVARVANAVVCEDEHLQVGEGTIRSGTGQRVHV